MTKKREALRYNWDELFDGKEHVLTRGKDFTGVTRAAASMVRYRARERRVLFTAEVIDDTKIRIFVGDPHAGKVKKAAAVKKPKAKAKPKPKPKPAAKKAASKPKAPAPKKAKAAAAAAVTPVPAIADVPPPPPPHAPSPNKEASA